MPQGDETHLRIYCICGQKMKVSEKMFGRPGKCVACRQKIRIPRLDELPDDVEEIHLRDHPEFLRKPRRPKPEESPAEETPAGSPLDEEDIPTVVAPRSEPAPHRPTPNEAEDRAVAVAVEEEMREDIALGGGDFEPLSTVPLDVLEPLRVICSVDHKLRTQYRRLKKEGAPESTRTDMKRRLKRVADVRAGLDDHLRQILMEVAIELASTHQKLNEAGLAARMGETTYADFQETADRLRRRRDRLEKRQQNLRGWLATTDPYLAGGYGEYTVDDLPEDGYAAPIPLETEEQENLLTHHTTALREAFQEISEARRQRAEIDRLRARDDAPRDLEAKRAQARANKKMAEAAVLFWRGRLEQLKMDYDRDAEIVSAQLDVARGKLQAGDIARPQFDQTEAQLLRAKTDLAKAKAVIDRALQAQEVQDVPHPRGTFLSRLTFADGIGYGPDSWMAWGGALLILVALVLPATLGNLSLFSAFFDPNRSGGGAGLLLWPIMYALLVAMAAALPNPVLRGRALGLLWLAATLFAVIAVHEAQYSIGTLAARFRHGPAWFLRPGFLTLLLAHGLIFGAFTLALAAAGRGFVWPVAAAAAAVVAILFVGLDYGGMSQPDPALAVTAEHDATLPEDMERHTIAVSNRGTRELQLSARPTGARGAYQLIVEQRIGAESWRPVALPEPFDARPLVAVGPKEAQVMSIALPPGDYRVQLYSEFGGETIEESFNIEAPPPPLVIEEEPELVIAPEEPAAFSPAAARISGIFGRDDSPRFSVELTGEDGSQIKINAQVGEVLPGGWTVSAYDGEQRLLSLTRPLSDTESETVQITTGAARLLQPPEEPDVPQDELE